MSQHDDNVKTPPTLLALARRRVKVSTESDKLLNMGGDALSVATSTVPGIFLGRLAEAGGVPHGLSKAVAPTWALGRGLWRTAQARELGSMGIAPRPLGERDLINSAIEGSLTGATWSGLGTITGAKVTPGGLGKTLALNTALSLGDRVSRYMVQKAAYNQHYNRAYPEPRRQDMIPKESAPRKPVKATDEEQRQHDKAVANKAALRLDGSSLVREETRIYKVPPEGRRSLLVESSDLGKIWFLAREEITRMRHLKRKEEQMGKESSLGRPLLRKGIGAVAGLSALADATVAPYRNLARYPNGRTVLEAGIHTIAFPAAALSPVPGTLPAYAAAQAWARNKFPDLFFQPTTRQRAEHFIEGLVKGSAPTRTFGTTPSGSVFNKRPGNTDGSISRTRAQGGNATPGGPAGTRPTGSPLSNRGVDGVVRDSATSATPPGSSRSMSAAPPPPGTAFSSSAGAAPAAPMARIPSTPAPRPPKTEKPIDTTPKTPSVPKISSLYGLLQAGPLIGAVVGGAGGLKSYKNMAHLPAHMRPSQTSHVLTQASAGAGIGWLPQLTVDGFGGMKDFMSPKSPTQVTQKQSSFGNAARQIGQHYASRLRYVGDQLKTPFQHADGLLQRVISSPDAIARAWASAPRRGWAAAKKYGASVAQDFALPIGVGGWNFWQGKGDFLRYKFGLLDPTQWKGGLTGLANNIQNMPLDDLLTPGPMLTASLASGGIGLSMAQGSRQVAKVGVGDVSAHALARSTGASHHVMPAALSPIQRFLSGQRSPGGAVTEASMVNRTGIGSTYGQNRSRYLGGEIRRADQLQDSDSLWDRLAGRSIERKVTGQGALDFYNSNAAQDLLAYYGGGGDKYLQRFNAKTNFINRGANRRWANRAMDYYDQHGMPLPSRPGQSTGPVAQQWGTFRKGTDVDSRRQASGEFLKHYEGQVNSRLGEMGRAGQFLQRHAGDMLNVPQNVYQRMVQTAPSPRAAAAPTAAPSQASTPSAPRPQMVGGTRYMSPQQAARQMQLDRVLPSTAPTRHRTYMDPQTRARTLQRSGAMPQADPSTKTYMSPQEAYKLLPKTSEAWTAERDGNKVGLFIPLPAYLDRFFETKRSVDASPAHVTMIYIGKVEPSRFAELVRICRQELEGVPAGEALMGGVGTFPAGDDGVPYFMQVKIYDELVKARDRLVAKLQGAGFELRGKGTDQWHPHCTLAYLPEGQTYQGPETIGSFQVMRVELWGLPERHVFELPHPMTLQKLSSRSMIRGATSALTWPLRASPMMTAATVAGAGAYGLKKTLGDPMQEAAQSWAATQRPEFADFYHTLRHGSGANGNFSSSPLYTQRPTMA